MSRLERTIGMDSLITLGGFIEDAIREEIKQAWEGALPQIVNRYDLGWHQSADMFVTLSRIINRKIETYVYDESKPDLYSQLMTIIEFHMENSKNQNEEMNTNIEPITASTLNRVE